MSLLFRVRTRLCGLPLAHVVETMRPLPVEAMAGTPSCVRGVAMIRGAPVPVLEVASLLREEEQAARAEPAARFVTVKVGERTTALAVDCVIEVRALAPTLFRALPPLLRDADVDVVDRIGMLDAELLFVLRAARLVSQSLEGPEVTL